MQKDKPGKLDHVEIMKNIDASELERVTKLVQDKLCVIRYNLEYVKDEYARQAIQGLASSVEEINKLIKRKLK
jgi:uncharacterized OsmC-like protein